MKRVAFAMVTLLIVAASNVLYAVWAITIQNSVFAVGNLVMGWALLVMHSALSKLLREVVRLPLDIGVRPAHWPVTKDAFLLFAITAAANESIRKRFTDMTGRDIANDPEPGDVAHAWLEWISATYFRGTSEKDF